MNLVHFKVFCFLLPSIVCQRPQVNPNLRGHSYGLENYLFQPYEEPEVNTIRHIKIKRVRPPPNYKVQGTKSESTVELENHPIHHEFSRLNRTQTNIEFRHRKPPEPNFETNRQNAESTRFDQQLPTVEVKREPIVAATQMYKQEVATEKIRRRITMRRRRKRPQNVTASDHNNNGLKIGVFKPSDIIKSLPAPKTTVQTIESYLIQNLTQTSKHNPVQTESPKAVEETTVAETTKFETTTAGFSTTSTDNPSAINLKTFLKQQTETLSLSELLQTQNLSLADLLRGNKDASAILKARQTVTTTTTATSAKRKVYNRVDPDKTTKELPKMEVLEVTTSKPTSNRFHPKFPRTKPTDVNTSKPQPLPNIADENSQPTKRPNLFNVNFDSQNRINELRLKLKNFQRKTSSPEPITSVTDKQMTTTTATTTEEAFVKQNKLSFQSNNNPELSLILPAKVKSSTENHNRPEKLSSWNNRLPPSKRFGQDKIKLSNDFPSKPIKTSFLMKEDTGTTEEYQEPSSTIPDIPSEETTKPESKDELIELLKSGYNANKLHKILTSRNMTLQELLDNREKHSLQQDISKLFTHHPLQATTTSFPTLFESLPSFLLNEQTQSKSSEVENYDEPYAEESALTIAKVEMIPNREPKLFQMDKTETTVNSHGGFHPDDLLVDFSGPQDSALWKFSKKLLHYGGSYGYGAQAVEPQTTENKKAVEVKSSPPPLTDSDIILLETIRKNQDTNRKFKLDLNDFVKEEEIPQPEDIEKSYIPPAVKSAIIASGVVMGIALFVFIAIFATCGWKQRQIQLKGSSSILGESLSKNPEKNKTTNTFGSVSFKNSKSYKKTCEFGDGSSDSGSSNAGSYLWSTLKNTFTTRTLRSRFEKEEKLREDKLTLRRNESRRKTEEETATSFGSEHNRFPGNKSEGNLIHTSFHFRRPANITQYDDCTHGY